MNAPKPWTTIAERSLLDCKVVRVDETTARAPDTDTEHTFVRLRAPSWVNVIALTPGDEVVLVEQFRHGSREVTLEIPGGMVDAGERPAAAAARELREETGYAAGSLEYLGAVNPNPALFDNLCHTYLAKDVRCVGDIQNEGAEETHVLKHPLAAIPQLIRSGAITHALVIAAFHWLELRDRY